MITKGCVNIGDHVAAFWINDFGKKECFLGIIEKQNSENKMISYLTKMGNNGRDWVFPEQEVRETDIEQLLSMKICVSYFCSTRIRCRIPQEVVNILDEQMIASCIEQVSIYFNKNDYF